jgi:hypothetical protein
LIQVGFRDRTGPGAGASSKDGDAFVHNFLERLAERRPTYWKDRAYHGLAKQRSGLGKKENLEVVAGFGKHKSVREGKGSLGGIVWSPGALSS